MFVFAPIVAYLALLCTPGWAGKCSDEDAISHDANKHNEHRPVVVTTTTTRSPGSTGKCSDEDAISHETNKHNEQRSPEWAGTCTDKEGMSDEIRQAFVDKHNEYRSLVAKGEAVNGQIGGFAPKAARMFKVSYDCDIENNMMAWAKKCVFAHSPWSDRKGLGQNIWMISLPNYNKTASAISATSDWFAELKLHGVPVANVMTIDVFNRGVGHYTQVVWQASDRIGCAVQSCPNSAMQMTFAGCEYKNAGNYMGSKIYETGNPCTKDSDCQCENCKCSAAEALCIRPDSTPMPPQMLYIG